MEHLQYPIGKLIWGKSYSFNETIQHINQIETLPLKINNLVKTFTTEDLQTSYRPNGWNGMQVIHHIADSHINAYCRLKLALTEDKPTIKPYREQAWAMLADYQFENISVSLQLIEAIHQRMTMVLKSMNEDDFQKEYYHPDNKIFTKLSDFAQAYAWHGNHHLHHLMLIKKIEF
jgi:hypothetical protein